MTTSAYLVLDQGGQSSRALIYNEFGDLISQASESLATATPKTNFVEQDSRAVIESVRSVAQRAYAALSDEEQAALKSVGIVCQRSSLVFWERETGNACTAVISWQDRRGHGILDELLDSAAISVESVREATGLYPNAHFGASKISWCLQELPELAGYLDEGRLRCGPLMSYLLNQLCDESPFLVDGGNASRTMLWNVYKQQWDENLLEVFKIPQAILPDITHNSREFGHLSLGERSLPVRYANGDQNAAFFALGYIDFKAMYVNLGTGGFCSALWQDTGKPAGSLLKSVVAAQAEPIYMLEGTVNGAASALHWAFKTLEMEADFDTLGIYLAHYDNPPLFMNGIGGLGSPFWRSSFKSQFVDSPTKSDANNEEKLVAVLESILFLLRCNYEQMLAAGLNLEKIHISGGLSRIDGLCQRLANLLQVPVYRADETEASARGAAFWLAGCPQSWREIPSDCFEPKKSGITARFIDWLAAVETRL